MQNLAIKHPRYENYKNNVISIKDWIAGKNEAVKKVGYEFRDNPEGTFNWRGFGQTALEFLYYPVEYHRRIVVLSGSIRSGKTTAMIDKWLTYCSKNPFGLKAIVGVSKDTIYQNVLSDLFNYLDTIGTEYRYNQSNGYLKVKYGKGEKEWFVCKVIGSKDKGSVKYLRGVTLSGAYIDELTLINRGFFRELLGRCSVANSKIFCTTNPDNPMHWAYTEFVKEGVNPDVEVWNFLLTDNPTLSQEYIDFICRQYKGTFYERFILGKWIIAEGLVYTSFDIDKHTCSHTEILEKIEQGEFLEYIAGIDWGWNHPTGVVLFGVTKEGSYYQLDELFGSKIDYIKVIAWLRDKQSEYGINEIRYIQGDDARPELNVKVREAGFNIYADKPGVKGSIAIIRAIINYDRIIVNRDRCPNTINEYLTYRYPSIDEILKVEDVDAPIKENDDLLDPTRYILHYYERTFGKHLFKKA